MKSYKGYLIGYVENTESYRVWVPQLHDVIVSRDISRRKFYVHPTFGQKASTKTIRNSQNKIVRLMLAKILLLLQIVRLMRVSEN